MIEEFIWAEKYRPHKIDDCILPPDLKKTFNKFVEQKNIPNLPKYRNVARQRWWLAMSGFIDCDVMWLMPLDVIRICYEIRNSGFASSVSFKKQRKYVIFDEADFLNHLVQPALRNFMQTYSKNCGFILTVNYPDRLMQVDRCSECLLLISSFQKIRKGLGISVFSES